MFNEGRVFVFDLKGTVAPRDDDPEDSFPIEEQFALGTALRYLGDGGRNKIVVASLAAEEDIRAAIDKYSLGGVVDELVSVAKLFSGGPKSYARVLERMKMSPSEAMARAVVTGDEYKLDRPDIDGMMFVHMRDGFLHDTLMHRQALEIIDQTGQGHWNLGHRMLVGGDRRRDMELASGGRIFTLSRDEIRHGDGPLIRTLVVSI